MSREKGLLLPKAHPKAALKAKVIDSPAHLWPVCTAHLPEALSFAFWVDFNPWHMPDSPVSVLHTCSHVVLSANL